MNCQQCNKLFEINNTRRAKYCSKECAKKIRLKKAREYKKKNKDKISKYNKIYKQNK